MVQKKTTVVQKNAKPNVITEVPKGMINRPTAKIELTVARDTRTIEVLIQTCDSVIQMVNQIGQMEKSSFSLKGLKDQLITLDPILTSIFGYYSEWVWTFTDVANFIEQYGDTHNTDVDSDIVKTYYFTLIVKVLENIKENLLYVRDNDPKAPDVTILTEEAEE